MRISAGFFFGDFDWRRRQVRVVHVNSYYYNEASVNHPVNTISAQTKVASINRVPGVWQHDPSHRRSIAYRNPALQTQFANPRPQRAEQPHSVPVPGIPARSTPSSEIRSNSMLSINPHVPNLGVGAHVNTEASDNRNQRFEHRKGPRPAEVPIDPKAARPPGLSWRANHGA